MTTVAVEQQAIQFGSYQGQSGPHVIRLDGPAGLYFLRGRNEVQPRLGSNGSGKTTLWRALCWEEMDKMDEL